MLERMNKSHFELTKWGLTFANLRDGDGVLDIGCGGGSALRLVRETIDAGRLCGIDYSDVSVKKTVELNKEAVVNKKMDVIKASVENIPFKDESFDKIFTVESFYFWPEPKENLKEVFRVLKKGGKFLLIAEIYGRDGLSGETIENIRKYGLFNPSKDEFRELFEMAGFVNIKTHTKKDADWICVEGEKN